MTENLIFTNAVVTRARQRAGRPLTQVERWATLPEPAGAAFREQLERVAALVPLVQRPRVLGPLLSGAANDEQVRDVVGGLMLAGSLAATGWSVEYEPEIDGKTPDYRITKESTTYVVELRRVTGRLARAAVGGYSRVAAALREFPRTRTPISIQHADVDGKASLKRFKRELSKVLAEARAGPRCIAYEGVTVAFDVHEPFEGDMPVLLGRGERFVVGPDTESVRAAVDEKVRRYKYPVIVALDLVDVAFPFEAVEDALFGTTAFSVPLQPGGGGGAGPPKLTRKQDGLAHGITSNAIRIQQRLVALVPFEWGATGGQLEVRPRLYGNPAIEVPHNFDEFAPMPRVVVSEDQAGLRTVQRLGATHLECDWSWSP